MIPSIAQLVERRTVGSLARPSLGRWFNSGSKECPFGSGPDTAAPLPFGPARVAARQGLPSLELLPEVGKTTSPGSFR